MNRRPTPETDEQRRIDNGDTVPLLDFAETLERERDSERALADRLAKSIMNWKLEQWRGTPEKATEQVMSALAAWKEARSE